MSRFVPLLAFILIGCASPYASHIRRIDADYRAGRLSYRDYISRRATYESADASWRGEQRARAQVLAHNLHQASQNYATQQQLQMERSLYYNNQIMQRHHETTQRTYQYPPTRPPSYRVQPNFYGGYDIEPY